MGTGLSLQNQESLTLIMSRSTRLISHPATLSGQVPAAKCCRHGTMFLVNSTTVTGKHFATILLLDIKRYAYEANYYIA